MLAIHKHVGELIQSALWPSQGWRYRLEVAGYNVLYFHVEREGCPHHNYVSVEVDGSEIIMFTVAKDYVSGFSRIDLSDPGSIELIGSIVRKLTDKLR